MDITKPTPERRAAKQAAERLTELTRSIGVQATTATTSPPGVVVTEVKGDETGAGLPTSRGPGRGGGENAEEEFGFTQEEMLSFKAKIEREKSMKCPVKVYTYVADQSLCCVILLAQG